MIILRGLNRVTKKIPVNLFFIELIIVLLFFSISGAVILKMFATADIMAKQSAENARAITCVQSVSEIYSVRGDLRSTCDKMFGRDVCRFSGDESCTVWLDEEFKPLVTDDGINNFARVRIEMSETAETGVCGRYSELTVAVYTLIGGEKLLLSQTCSSYIPDFEGGADIE